MEPHGHVKFKWRKNIMITHMCGPFNLEGVAFAFDELKTIVNNSEIDHWYRIDYLDDNTMGSPEVIASIGRAYVWASNNNCQQAAVVCCNLLQKSLMDSFIALKKIKVKTFINADEAIECINSVAKNFVK